MKKTFVLMVFVCLCVVVMMVNNVRVNAENKCEVKFTFDGLQAIAFGNADRVTDGILDVHHHIPKLEIKEIQKGKEKVIASFEGKELYKKVLNISIPNKLQKPSRYYSADMSKDTRDFRWCLDIENDLFQKQLYLKEDKFYTKINFSIGEFITQQITKDKYQFATNNRLHSFNREIGTPAANLRLEKGDSLVITGLSKNVVLSHSEQVSYLVNITNLPPEDMANIDHFAFYYDFVKAEVPQYMPNVVVKKASFRPGPMVCEAVIFGKSSIK